MANSQQDINEISAHINGLMADLAEQFPERAIPSDMTAEQVVELVKMTPIPVAIMSLMLSLDEEHAICFFRSQAGKPSVSRLLTSTLMQSLRDHAEKLIEEGNKNILVRYEKTCGESWIEGVFVCSVNELESIVGREAPFGEFSFKIEADDFTILSEDPYVVCSILPACTNATADTYTLRGSNPFDFFSEKMAEAA